MTKRPSGKGSGKAKGKGKSKRRDPRKGPSASSGKRPGKGTKKVAPTAAPSTTPSAGISSETGSAAGKGSAGQAPTAKTSAAKTARVNTGGTAKAPFSVGRAPRPLRPAAAKSLALKAERAAAAEAAKAASAATAAPRTAATKSARAARAPGPGIRDTSSNRDAGNDEPGVNAAPPEPTSTFTLGYIAGATPGRWADIWSEREPLTQLVLHPLVAAEQRTALDAEVNLALVRLPIEGDGDVLHVIALYDEVPHVVVSIDSELSVLDELTLDDLAGQLVIRPADDVLGAIDVAHAVAPLFAPPASTEEAIATVAAGVGIVIVPQSLARLHRRKDVTSRPLLGGPTSSVGLAWRSDRESEDVRTFVGIVRGRKTSSSR